MRRLDRSKVAVACRRLTEQIEKDGAPSVIVSIRTGGEEIGQLLAGMLGCKVVEVHIARPDRTRIYKRIARVSKMLATIVYEFLFLIDRPCMIEMSQIPQGADVLIVDDAIQSGKTIRLARRWVKGFSPRRMRVAAITDMRWWNVSEYHIYRSLVSFPWSRNYRDKKEKVSGVICSISADTMQ
jgi:hypoxanthine phosphoribosyltransferase